MFYRGKRWLRTRRFDQKIKAALNTPPIRIVDAPWTIVSMISQRDVPMYLLSIKAFYRRMGAGRIVGIIDADLSEKQRSLLRRHIDGIELQVLEAIDTGACQRGGTWERLVFCLERSRDSYVIQIDSDVLAYGDDISEVLNCASNNIPFTLADNTTIVSMREAAHAAQALPEENYIGLVTERAFDRYPGCDELRYVRGSSGFVGFSHGGFSRQAIEEFHRNMATLIGPRWSEWGTEQCGSNFAVANSPGAVLLPFPSYSSFHPGGPRLEAKCLHFIGRFRFDEDFFADRGRDEIKLLMRTSGTVG